MTYPNRIKNKIAVIGDGGWGTTLAILLSRKGYRVCVWGAFKDYAASLQKNRINKKFLPGVAIPRSVIFTHKLDEALKEASIIILAVPSQFMAGVLKKMKPFDVSRCIVVSVTKGIEIHTLKRMSELIRQHLGRVRLAVLSGPTIAEEVAHGIPTTAVVASSNAKVAKMLQDVFTTQRFRIYTSHDVIGVELGGSLKNIIAIACGISDGLGFGSNTKSALLARGLAEMSRLGVRLGADARTFSGISGLGDLVTTCISRYSRNRFVGEQIGRGRRLGGILKKMEMVAEGVPTARSVYRLSRKYHIDMPITREVYHVLYKNKNSLQAVGDLMGRQKKHELF